MIEEGQIKNRNILETIICMVACAPSRNCGRGPRARTWRIPKGPRIASGEPLESLCLTLFTFGVTLLLQSIVFV